MSISLIPKNPEELGEALSQLTERSLILGGGTDLIIVMREKLLSPDKLLSLSDIPELREIRVTEDTASIGAMATMTEVEHALAGYPELRALSEAAGGVGSVQIRNKGTIGGNVANASPAGDLPPVLWMLDAEVELMGPAGALRSVPIRAFIRGVKDTDRAYNEVLTRFIIDRRALAGFETAFEKLGHREQVTISRIGLAAALKRNAQGVVMEARVVAGAIQTKPFRLEAAEQLLIGTKAEPTAALAVAIGDTFEGNTRRRYKAAAAKGVAENLLKRFAKKTEKTEDKS